MAEKHENSLLSGRPFTPGVSGNPRGRPSYAAIRAALKPHEKETVERLVALMKSADKDSTSLDAVKTILGYLYGKPSELGAADFTKAELLAAVNEHISSDN